MFGKSVANIHSVQCVGYIGALKTNLIPTMEANASPIPMDKIPAYAAHQTMKGAETGERNVGGEYAV